MKLFKAILFVVALVIIVASLSAFAPDDQARQPFEWIIAKKLTVRNGATIDSGGLTVTAGGLTVSAGGADITGDITLENDETINNSTDGFIGFTGGQLWSTTTVTATDGLVITPTAYTLYNLDSSAAVTVTLAACTEGGPVILAGDDANTITIADSNIRTDDGAAAAVGQYDLFMAICVDSEWLQISNQANQ